MEDKTEPQKLGLGDLLEKGIEKIAPKLAQIAKEKGCNCEKRKEWLNNIGAKFG